MPINATNRLRVLTMTTLALLTTTTLHAQIWKWTPPNLSTWSDLDGTVSNTYAGLTSMIELCPPGPWHAGLNQGYFTFDPNGELASATNLFIASTQFCVTVWQVSVSETQTTPRAWLYKGAGGVFFRTNECPSSYDPTQWVQHAYGHAAPSYLTGTNLDKWYTDRDRSRFALGFILVNSNDWTTLQSAVRAAATNAPSPGPWTPSIPADTNNMSFLNVLPSAGGMDLWVYTPVARPVAVLVSTNLLLKRWAVLGSFVAVPPFTLWHASVHASDAFYRTGFTDVDSDGDGIPDFLETNVYGTDPNKWDTDGDGSSDFEEIFIYGTDPLNGDSVTPNVLIASPVAGEWKAVMP